jgi:hypothetical protein
VFPPLSHATPPLPASAAVWAKAPEQQLAQDEQPYCLPEGDRFSPENPGHQGIPETHHHETKYANSNNREKDDLKSSQHPIIFHCDLNSARIRCE